MALPSISAEQRRARLVARHRLAPATRTDDVPRIVDDLVGLHSSDPVTVYLSATARMAHPDLAAVERALYQDRSLLRHHAMRRTLWVFGPQHARLAHHAATVDVAAVQRRNLHQQLTAGGYTDPEATVADARARIRDLLVAEGPMPAREVGLRLPELTTPVPIQATVQALHSRVLLVMGFDGEVLRARPTGTWINGQYRWAAADAWVPGGLGEPLPRREAAAGLARAYLRAFGPATRDDLKWWAGWTVATTKAALADVGAVETDAGFVLPDDVPDGTEVEPQPSVVLLPGLDPTTMGWKERDHYLDPALVPHLFDRNGNGGPTIWVAGAIVGGWVQRKDGTIALKLLTDVGAEARAQVEGAAHALEALLGEVRFTVRFPAPMAAELLA
ncbi:winged helix DNA-binding domain-containing protein [Pseudonocardia sp. RS11V-5]|uniref:winged helix DNA-binding domain-containing protein n=1 Tax=Pseudonocardia terrae TaxID=2905831 RepID=UPI001E46801C|nr:winged helix DNA-binding domain-containing protein [Pseudonocardia terrae]MCE3554559.1 winged helix DNA-binding domain-containing protein [Pseudonocardia terrae]